MGQADNILRPVLVPLRRPRPLPTPGRLLRSPTSPRTPYLSSLNIPRRVLLLPCPDLHLPLPGLLRPSARVADGITRMRMIGRHMPLSAGVAILQSILRPIWLFRRVHVVRG